MAQQPADDTPKPAEELPRPSEESDKPVKELPTMQVREDFSDEDLQKFVKANEKIVSIQAESEQRMISTIEKAGLSVDRFNQILQAMQSPDRAQLNASPQELSSFNHAAQTIIEEKQKTEREMVASVVQEGIDVQTFQEIMIAYDQNPKVQQKINKIIGGVDK